LKAALLPTFRKVKETKDVIVHPNINVRTNGHFSTVNLAIRPIPSRIVEFEHLYLVILEERKPSVPVPVTAAPTTTSASEKDLKPDDIIANLKERLRAKAEFLHSTQEELMSSNEELKSANEELQSMNEELQSTNEELETSKEELQSINEELTTVNSELQIKVADLTRANNDMNNLMAGTGIATLFVDIELRILRFTPSIVKIINLIEADVGRPISHIVSNLGEYKTLNNDIQNVLNNLVPLELEVVTNDGLWYLMRIRPYRTTENVIEGAVVSFTDISSIVEARETAKSMNKLSRMAVIVRDSFDAIILQDLKGQILAWNPAATKLYGWTEFEALRLNVRDRIPKELMVQEVETLSRIQKAEVIETYVTKRLHKNGGSVPISIAASQLQDDCGKAYAITTIERKLNGDIA
jgi:two-component system, chemotaxis family, CheB/CheR fusion protein